MLHIAKKKVPTPISICERDKFCFANLFLQILVNVLRKPRPFWRNMYDRTIADDGDDNLDIDDFDDHGVDGDDTHGNFKDRKV